MSDWRDDADKRYKQKQQGKYFRLAEGENCLRVLPGMIGEKKLGGPPFMEYAMHSEVGPDQRFLRCGKDETGEGKCWLCDAQIPKLRASGEQAKRARAAKLDQQWQFAVQAAWIDEDHQWHGPVVWRMSSSGPTGGGGRAISTQILGVLRNRKRDIVDLKAGYNLNIERTGTTMRATRYGAIIVDTEPTAVPKEIWGKMKPLESLISVYSEEEQKAAYFGREIEEGAGGGEEAFSDEETEGGVAEPEDESPFGDDGGEPESESESEPEEEQRDGQEEFDSFDPFAEDEKPAPAPAPARKPAVKSPAKVTAPKSPAKRRR